MQNWNSDFLCSSQGAVHNWTNVHCQKMSPVVSGVNTTGSCTSTPLGKKTIKQLKRNKIKAKIPFGFNRALLCLVEVLFLGGWQGPAPSVNDKPTQQPAVHPGGILPS